VDTKDEIHRLVDALSDEDAQKALEYIVKLLEEPDIAADLLPPEEVAEIREELEAMRRGEYISLEDYERARGL
jgi:hypothetical protein